MQKTITYINTKRAVDYFDGPTNLAKAAGVIRITVYNWLEKGHIPEGYTSKIYKAAKARKKCLDRLFEQVMK